MPAISCPHHTPHSLVPCMGPVGPPLAPAAYDWLTSRPARASTARARWAVVCMVVCAVCVQQRGRCGSIQGLDVESVHNELTNPGERTDQIPPASKVRVGFAGAKGPVRGVHGHPGLSPTPSQRSHRPLLLTETTLRWLARCKAPHQLVRPPCGPTWGGHMSHMATCAPTSGQVH